MVKYADDGPHDLTQVQFSIYFSWSCALRWLPSSRAHDLQLVLGVLMIPCARSMTEGRLNDSPCMIYNDIVQ